MNLTPDEGRLFYDLYAALLSFVNRKLEVSPETFSDSREYTSTSQRVKGQALNITCQRKSNFLSFFCPGRCLLCHLARCRFDLGAFHRGELAECPTMHSAYKSA